MWFNLLTYAYFKVFHGFIQQKHYRIVFSFFKINYVVNEKESVRKKNVSFPFHFKNSYRDKACEEY